jgi:hypothetical protein
VTFRTHDTAASMGSVRWITSSDVEKRMSNQRAIVRGQVHEQMEGKGKPEGGEREGGDDRKRRTGNLQFIWVGVFWSGASDSVASCCDGVEGLAFTAGVRTAGAVASPPPKQGAGLGLRLLPFTGLSGSGMRDGRGYTVISPSPSSRSASSSALRYSKLPSLL